LAWAGEQPYCLEEHSYPTSIGERMLQHDLTTGALVDLRQQITGLPDHSSMRVEAHVATARQARLLSIRRGGALLVSVHTFWDPIEQPQELLLLAFAGDRFVLKLDLPLESARCWERR